MTDNMDVIGYSDNSFEFFDRQAREQNDALARRHLNDRYRLAGYVATRQGGRVLRFARLNNIDLSDLSVREDIVAQAALPRFENPHLVADSAEVDWRSDHCSDNEWVSVWDDRWDDAEEV